MPHEAFRDPASLMFLLLSTYLLLQLMLHPICMADAFARIDAKLEQYAARHAAVPRLPPVAGAATLEQPQPT